MVFEDFWVEVLGRNFDDFVLEQRRSVAKKEGEVFSTEFSYVAPILSGTVISRN